MIEKIITYQYQGDSRRFISIGMNLEAFNPAQKPFWYSVELPDNHGQSLQKSLKSFKKYIALYSTAL